ncbi:MAG: type II secretion system F family protein [Actinobacteria bacterium]|nr:type II secretion system F family protein [Actinomycetota bacterium]
MNGLQWWILVGLMVSGGILLIGWRLVPAQPDLADALARLAPTTARRTATGTGGEPADLTDRLGLWALRNLPGRLSGNTPHRDLAILGRSIQRLYGEKLLFAVILAAAVPVLAAIYGMVLPVPPAFAAAGVALGAVLGWRLPTANLARAAAQARLEFNRALGSYVDLVALERSAGSSAPGQALENAAEIGDSWPFQRISDELARSWYSGETTWDAIGHLADELGLPALDDVADIMRLAGAEGSQVHDTLRARSTALRSQLLMAEQARAKARSTRMTIPSTLMAIVFAAVLVTAAVLRLTAG